ncbi:hypothetical protein PBAL39_23687 [Pedobacter sp. BAL39]|uniref:class I SAM-dependent methyltransferase n=1 Tax=Pedobacter sp. BAL39 TaxID=391596 RepID=UPI0001559431|nr:class I SAM-dependent methyltransferase [Pedobacter sp. BAL39]EDM36063.1 hypothetical protein PBAL39_23687 [Pedobacter sp. BAL39]
MFHERSYDQHKEWYNHKFPTEAAKASFYQQKKKRQADSAASWLQQLFFNCIDPLLKREGSWLTVGDAYGFDAAYVLRKGSKAIATDLNGDFLHVAKVQGLISTFAIANAESLFFEDQSFDYVLCKESYHHFPRPYAAVYEMIRVAVKAVIIIEPQDPVTKMPLLLWLVNLTSSCYLLQRKIWKNRFSFEPVGNFVYKVSEREFEKTAAGLNLPAVAFRKINPNFYTPDVEVMKADRGKIAFLYLYLKKRLLDLLTKIGVIPGQVLSTIIFKTEPDQQTIAELKKGGYKVVHIPENPYSPRI